MREKKSLLKLLLLALICLIIPDGTINSKTNQKFPSGLGFEFGLGHNQMFWDAGSISADRKEFSITPTFRLFYSRFIHENISVAPFMGYNKFGGKSEEDPNGYKDEFWFHALEIGGFAYYQKASYKVGLGIKLNRHIKIISRHFGSWGVPYDPDWSWDEDDVTDSNMFSPNKLSYNIGLKAGWIYRNISISGEAWFGLKNLVKGGAFDDAGVKVHENHYRLIFGYEL